MDTRSRAFEERTDARLRSLEGQLAGFRDEVIGMFTRWNRGPNTQLKDKQVAGDKEAPPPETPRVSRKYVIPAAVLVKPSASVDPVEGDPWSARCHKTLAPRGSGGKFSLPKSPKMDVLAFKGDGDVLHWLSQMDHLCLLVEDRVEFRAFYLKDEALVCWR